MKTGRCHRSTHVSQTELRTADFVTSPVSSAGDNSCCGSDKHSFLPGGTASCTTTKEEEWLSRRTNNTEHKKDTRDAAVLVVFGGWLLEGMFSLRTGALGVVWHAVGAPPLASETRYTFWDVEKHTSLVSEAMMPQVAYSRHAGRDDGVSATFAECDHPLAGAVCPVHLKNASTAPGWQSRPRRRRGPTRRRRRCT